MSEKIDYFLVADHYIGLSSIPISIVGFVFNSLVFYILSRPKFLKETMFRYFIVNETLDSLVLLIGLTTSIKYIFSVTKWTGDISCKLIEYIAEIILMLYPLLITLISIDRFIAIKYKDSFEFRKTVK